MKIKYCLPIIKSLKKDVLTTIQDNLANFNYFEIWLDYIKDIELDFINLLKKRYGEKIVFLLRRQRLAKPKISLLQRIKILNCIAGSNCFLDLDLFSQKEEIDYLNKNRKKIKLIISYHNYKETPEDQRMKQIVEKLLKMSPEIIKISTLCKQDDDALRLIDLMSNLKDKNIRNIVIGMGKKGRITRIAGGIIGTEMCFTPVTINQKSAPGQFTKKQFEDAIRK